MAARSYAARRIGGAFGRRDFLGDAAAARHCHGTEKSDGAAENGGRPLAHGFPLLLAVGVTPALIIVAAVVLLTLPITLMLRTALQHAR